MFASMFGNQMNLSTTCSNESCIKCKVYAPSAEHLSVSVLFTYQLEHQVVKNTDIYVAEHTVLCHDMKMLFAFADTVVTETLDKFLSKFLCLCVVL